MKTQSVCFSSVLLLAAGVCRAEIKVVSDRNSEGSATARFQFKNVPGPVRGDAGEKATFTLVAGQRDANGGELSRLHDGKLARNQDQPAENFFFSAGTDGGRLRIDLGAVTELKQVNTYSWHPGARGPQVYSLYFSTGGAAGFDSMPAREKDPASCGWTLAAKVDTRPGDGSGGGQHGVSIAGTAGSLGSSRYLLFDISRTEDTDAFGNTFYTEIDVVAVGDTAMPAVIETTQPITKTFTAGDGRFHFVMDTTIAPDLTDWADKELRPVVQEWYPKLVAMLPSDGYSPRTNVTLRFRDDMGGTPASAGGGFINCNAGWFRRELKREARGSVVHEMVHVVQNYRRVRRDDTNATRMPGWLVEGIPDYIRWFLYEPQTKGAEITARNLSRAKYDASYRITGNFLNWASAKYDTNLVQKLNAAGREGKYREGLWKELTGKSVEELGADWKRFHEDRLAEASPASKPAAP